ncbi:hypothetical protein SEA_FAITH5X5_54 [Gordonia phage Faith5x5]|nr:hypothetical protein SEA_FAITH5X5_54 [Gordonia phage Faith5x5]
MTDHTPNLEQAAQIIAAHQIDSTWSRWLSGEEGVGDETIRCLCDCGEELDLDDHAAHVVAVIRDRGLTVIALPEADGPDVDGQYRISVHTRRTQDDGHLLIEPVNHWGERPIRMLGIPLPPRNADEAADPGAALIAAAQHAGDTQ